MNDESLQAAFTALGPSPRQRRAVEARVFEWLDARDTPLVAEWLGLVRIAPLSAAGLIVASALALATAPPLAWLTRALL